MMCERPTGFLLTGYLLAIYYIVYVLTLFTSFFGVTQGILLDQPRYKLKVAVQLFQRLRPNVSNRLFQRVVLLRSYLSRAWHHCIELVGRICLLFLPDLPHLSRCADKGSGFGHISCNGFVKFPQVVARNSSIHVVFNVPVHVPIKE
jgi:hypothetical protein